MNIEKKEVKLNLDPELFPETVEFFTKYVDDEISAYEMATELVQCDKTSDMTRELFDFIVRLYKEAIDEGNVEAMNDLGALYYDGRGCEQDFTKAVYYYDMAAKSGSRQAQENLGYCFYYGRNMPVDYEKAFHYFALGAFDGHIISLYKIGDMYKNGYYVEKNLEEAFRIYSHCLDTMSAEAASVCAGPLFLRVGNAFLNGEGTEKNAKSALVCFQKAEVFLYDMVENGDVMYKKSLIAAIEGQAIAREQLAEALPNRDWQNDS